MMFHYMKMFLPHKGNILFVNHLVHNLQDSANKKNKFQRFQHAKYVIIVQIFFKELSQVSNLVGV